MSICRCAHLKKHSLLFSKTRNCPHARTADCLIAYCSMMKEEKGHLQPMVEPKTPVRAVRTVLYHIYHKC